MKTNDGGPAYPSKGGMLIYLPESMEKDARAAIESMDREVQGMTMRQWYKRMPTIDEIKEIISDRSPAGLCQFLGIQCPQANSRQYAIENNLLAKAYARARGILADAMIAEDDEHGRENDG